MIEALENRINYKFKNRELAFTALTHRSHSEGSREKGICNERLEFLGDAVIGLAVTDFLYRRMKERNEGELAKIKAHLVSSSSLFAIARKIELGKFVFLGKGEEKNQGRTNKNILSAAFEALVGAVYLDSGFRLASQWVLRFFEDILDPLIQPETRINDYKSELQEVVQKYRNLLPQYRILEESGKPPYIHFTVAVFLENQEIGRGTGRNRREAEQKAALYALQNIGNFMGFEKLSEVFFIKND